MLHLRAPTNSVHKIIIIGGRSIKGNLFPATLQSMVIEEGPLTSAQSEGEKNGNPMPSPIVSVKTDRGRLPEDNWIHVQLKL